MSNTYFDKSFESDKEELDYLRQFRHDVLQYIEILCNYDVKYPVRWAWQWAKIVEELNKDLDSQISLFIKKIFNSTDQALDILFTSLFLSNLEQGRFDFELDKELINIKNIIKSITNILVNNINYQNDMMILSYDHSKENNNLQPRRIQVSTQIPDDLPEIYGDKSFIYQILKAIVSIPSRIPSLESVFLNAVYDINIVSFRLEWKSQSYPYLASVFEEFPNASNVFSIYSDPASTLYMIWRLAQLSHTPISFDVTNEINYKITITFRRSVEPEPKP